MSWIDLIETVAGVMTTIAFLPQVVKTWRSQSAEDISLLMFLIFSLGVFLWMLYGIGLGSLPIVIANGITLLLAGSILVMKLRFTLMKRRRMQAAGQRAL